VVERTARHSPDFIAQHLPRARAYQLRYLARRALQLGDPGMANTLLREAFRSSRKPLTEEPVKSLVTLAAAYASQILSPERYARLMGAVAGGRLVA
jgi:hypothetical protein